MISAISIVPQSLLNTRQSLASVDFISFHDFSNLNRISQFLNTRQSLASVDFISFHFMISAISIVPQPLLNTRQSLASVDFISFHDFSNLNRTTAYFEHSSITCEC